MRGWIGLAGQCAFGGLILIVSSLAAAQTKLLPPQSTWVGAAECGRSKPFFKMQLSIAGNVAQAVATYGAAPGFSMPTGQLRLRGSYDAKSYQIDLKPETWVTQPRGVNTLLAEPFGVKGAVSSDGGTLSADFVAGGECRAFSARRVNYPPGPANNDGLLFRMQGRDGSAVGLEGCIDYANWLVSGEHTRVSNYRFNTVLLNHDAMREILGRSFFQWGPQDHRTIRNLNTYCSKTLKKAVDVRASEALQTLQTWTVSPLDTPLGGQGWLIAEAQILAQQPALYFLAQQQTTKPKAPQKSAAERQQETKARAQRAAERAAQMEALHEEREAEDRNTLIMIIGPIVLLGLVVLYLFWKYPAVKPKKEARDPDLAEANIDARFDQKTGSERAVIRDHVGGAVARFFRARFAYEIERNLAAMDSRGRECLRVAELLFNRDLLSPSRFALLRAALLFDDGKCQLLDFEGTGISEHYPYQNGFELIRMHLNLHGLSTEGAVSEVLGHLTKLAEQPSPHPTVTRCYRNLVAGNAWSSEDETTGQKVSSAAKPNGVILGRSSETGEQVRFHSEGSLVTIAPPGSGKTQCNVIPNLLEWRGPAVVLDVKGDIYESTSGWREENVGPVYRFSPLDPNNSHRYNPLALIRDEREWLWEDCRFVAEMLIVPNDNARDPFFDNRARSLLTAIIAHIVYYNDLPDRQFSKAIDIAHRVGWATFVDDLITNEEIPSMRRAGHSIKEMTEKTLDAVLQTLESNLTAWEGARVETVTQASDWQPMDLRSENPPTIYICLRPNEIDAYVSLLRVFIAQHIRALSAELPERGTPDILFLLDELPRLKHMPPVEEALDVGRQYGIKLWLFAQNLGQMNTAYPNAEGMIGSAAVRMFMNPSAHDGTAEKISTELGERQSLLDGERAKLVEAHELGGPEYADKVIALVSGEKPLLLDKDYAYQRPAYQERMSLAPASVKRSS